jgi:hypothetical protein
MTQPKYPSEMPEGLRELVHQLAKLPAGEREVVIQAARDVADELAASLPTISWESLNSAIGIVSWGGNALEDSEAIYDG